MNKINSKRVDFENAEEYLMRSVVNNRPLFPIFEAIYNALHASIERGVNKIKVKLNIERDNDCLIDNSRIIGFSVEDSGIGFTKEKTKAFFELFTKNKKLKFNSRGIGRLAYFSAFKRVKVESIFKNESSFYQRNFDVTLDSFDLDELPDANESQSVDYKTVVSVSGVKDIVSKKYNICPEVLVDRIREEFSPSILTLDDFSIYINDGNKQFIVQKSDYNADKGDNFTVKNWEFEIYFIKELSNPSKNHGIVYAASGRKVEGDSISILDKSKLELPDEPKFYLKCIICSDVLDKNINATRTGFLNLPDIPSDGDLPSFEEIRDAAYIKIREFIYNKFPNAKTANEKTIKQVLETAPHLASISESPGFISKLPIYCNKERVLTELTLGFMNEQVASFNYVAQTAQKYKDNEIPDFDTFLEKELEKLQDGVKLNHAPLLTYVKYREHIINIFKQLLKRRDDDKYQKEAVLHNLIFPRNYASEDWKNDYHKHNLWLIDDRFAAYQFLFSDYDEYRTAERQKTDDEKRYDINGVYKDNLSYQAQNILLIELKKTHLPLSRDNDPIEQIRDYVHRIREGKIDTRDGERIHISESTMFHGIVVCDIENEYFKTRMIENYGLKKRPDGKSYFCTLLDGSLFLEVTNYEFFIDLAQIRNKAFIEKLHWRS